MSDWKEIIQMYETAAKRTGTPYVEFGNSMLDLVYRIQTDEHLKHLEPSTAMWMLCLSVPSNAAQSIHISWNNGKYVIYLTGAENIKEEMELEEVVDTIGKYAQQAGSSDDR